MDIIEKEIEKLLHGIPLNSLKKYFKCYSSAYRGGKGSEASLPSKMEKICYLATRFPATSAAVTYVLKECERRMGKVTSCLDLGSGPGTTLFSMLHLGWELERVVLVERNKEFTLLGKSLIASLEKQEGVLLPSIAWHEECMSSFLEKEGSYDLSIFSYSIGEIEEKELKPILERAFQRSKKGVVIVEPGTPRAFKHLLKARRVLTMCGGHVVAPCPSSQECPLAHREDWCHFSTRLSRTSLHRKIKEGDLGYEDEKFSYMIIAKEPLAPCPARILKQKRNSGHIQMELCTPFGLKNTTISKKDNDLFKIAKKKECGDCFFI